MLSVSSKSDLAWLTCGFLFHGHDSIQDKQMFFLLKVFTDLQQKLK